MECDEALTGWNTDDEAGEGRNGKDEFYEATDWDSEDARTTDPKQKTLIAKELMALRGAGWRSFTNWAEIIKALSESDKSELDQMKSVTVIQTQFGNELWRLGEHTERSSVNDLNGTYPGYPTWKVCTVFELIKKVVEQRVIKKLVIKSNTYII